MATTQGRTHSADKAITTRAIQPQPKNHSYDTRHAAPASVPAAAHGGVGARTPGQQPLAARSLRRAAWEGWRRPGEGRRGHLHTSGVRDHRCGARDPDGRQQDQREPEAHYFQASASASSPPARMTAAYAAGLP